MYRTGDLGRRLPDGNFEFIGRIDAQIKLDGHRIEPGEIEAFLMQRSEVAEAAVVKQSDHSGNGRLVAYLILRAGAASAPSEIRQWLKDRLPEYMVPGHFVVLEAMPRTSSGKTDRSRLQADISPLPTPVETGVTSESIDDTVLRIWKRQLGCGEVNVDDNFFDVGGSSMLAISIHEELQSCLKRSFPVVDMFEFPTVRSLSQRLGGMTGVPG
jgi:aspartate racemase